MSKRDNRKIATSKIYHPNDLSMILNNDFSHQKMWSQKVEEAKHIQEQKQIDRILTGIVKQRLFGNLLAQDSRISTEGYYNLDKISKRFINPIKLPTHSKIYPLPNQPEFSRITRNSIKHRTIDAGVRRKAQTIDFPDNTHSQLSKTRRGLSKKNSMEADSLNETRRNFLTKKISISKFPNFNNHFRQITGNQSSMIYDIKMNREMLIKYSKKRDLINQRSFQRFLYFFNFPNGCNLRQFSNWVESCGNCLMKQSAFFVFQTLDESGNGFLTISDLFRALQDFPHNEQHERQIYEITEMIKKITSELDQNDIDFRVISKPTVEQILIRNQSIKIDELRQLVKESNKNLISANCVKSTTYHQSLHALEHTATVREKKNQLESEERTEKNNRKYKEENDISMKQDGIRFRDFAVHFNQKRPRIFALTMNILLGETLPNIQ